jgi:FkbM family methyltransferase
MSFSVAVKHLALSILPEPILQRLRKTHYAKKLNTAPEEPEMSVIPHLVPLGGTALDLGANFGLYTQFLARVVGPNGRVYALEPVPTTFDVLSENVRRIGLDNVQVHPFAVSDEEGTVTMAVPTYARGGENFYEARIIRDASLTTDRIVEVATRRLDDLFGVLGRIDFVKCDVEAHELAALRGATNILRVHRPSWLIEVSGNPDDADSSAAAVMDLMKRSGYRPFQLDELQGETETDQKRSCNYFFLRPEHVRRLNLGES